MSPISVPKNTIMNRAPRTKGIGTVGFVYGKSVKSWVEAFIPNKTKAPRIIPITPAINVKKNWF